MKGIVWIIIIVVVVIGFFALSGRNQPTAPATDNALPGAVEKKEPPSALTPAGKGEVMEKKGIAVTYENNTFNPQTVTVKVGETVTFTNKHVSAIRVSSNPHPIHTSYPQLESDRLEPGQSYAFTAKEKVTISYHNHFNPAVGGKIAVE